MPPKKSKATGKGKAKAPAKEPAANGAPDSTVAEANKMDHAPGVAEAKEAESAQTTNEPPAADAQPLEPATKAEDVKTKAKSANKSKSTVAEANKMDHAPGVAEAKEAESAQTTNEPPAADAQPLEPATEAEDVKTEAKSANKSKKRKANDTPSSPQKKASRRSTRGGSKAHPTEQQLLTYLLSSEAADLCRPDDEIADLENRSADTRTYTSSVLTPFEELICAIVLSRPISHSLGMRTIRTIFNDPYNFTTPKAIIDAGTEKRRQSMYDAHTQHKEKTADQLGLAAEAVIEKFSTSDTDTDLSKLREEAGKDWDEMRDLSQTNIKGLGKTGSDIFFRRVQWSWPEAFPFVDERTARGLEKMGSPKRTEDLVKAIDAHCEELDTKALHGKDKDEKKRRAFVVVCERATGADLEGKTDAVSEAAATA